MSQTYTAVRQTILSGAADASWRLLIEGASLSKWFADSGDLVPGGSFHFAFGDGDFFSGRVTEWAPPVSLGLEWRFLDVGPSFDIRFSLLPVGEGTELSVQDRGAASALEAAGLREGWEDFLMRCEQLARTGQNSRYRWTEIFGATAFVAGSLELRKRLGGPRFWADYFPEARIALRPKDPQTVCMEFEDPVWAGVRTQAQASLVERAGRMCLAVRHLGWETLPLETQVAERSRYAARWARLLKDIEPG